MRFSISQLKKFLRCPYSYYLYYREDIKLGVNVNLVVGSAIHKGFEMALKQIRAMGTFDIDEIVSIVERDFEERLCEVNDTPEKIEDGRQKIKHARKVLEMYNFPKQHEIISVEERFVSTSVADIEVVAYPDLITVDGVIDFKTTHRTPSEVRRGDLLQVGFYSTFGDIEKATLVYVVLLKKQPKIVERVFIGEELESAKKMVKALLPAVVKNISLLDSGDGGNWLPSGLESGACNFCEYASERICEFGCGGKVKI